MLTTTLNKIREQKPCSATWEKLLRNLGKTQADDEPLPFSVILQSNGIDDAIWCCRAAPEYSKEWRLFAVRCARAVQHLVQSQRSMAAIDVAERFAWRQAAEDELRTAWDAAWDAAVAASAAAWDAADGARDGAWAADAAARAAARAAADAAWAARAARPAAYAAAWAAAAHSVREQQTQDFLDLCNGTAEWVKDPTTQS